MAGSDLAKPIGVNWVIRFISRISGLEGGRSQALTKDRIQAAISDILDKWYIHLSEVIQRYKIDSADIWNMDEIGFSMGHHQKESVVFDRRSGPPIALASGTTA